LARGLLAGTGFGFLASDPLALCSRGAHLDQLPLGFGGLTRQLGAFGLSGETGGFLSGAGLGCLTGDPLALFRCGAHLGQLPLGFGGLTGQRSALSLSGETGRFLAGAGFGFLASNPLAFFGNGTQFGQFPLGLGRLTGQLGALGLSGLTRGLLAGAGFQFAGHRVVAQLLKLNFGFSGFTRCLVSQCGSNMPRIGPPSVTGGDVEGIQFVEVRGLYRIPVVRAPVAAVAVVGLEFVIGPIFPVRSLLLLDHIEIGRVDHYARGDRRQRLAHPLGCFDDRIDACDQSWIFLSPEFCSHGVPRNSNIRLRKNYHRKLLTLRQRAVISTICYARLLLRQRRPKSGTSPRAPIGCLLAATLLGEAHKPPPRPLLETMQQMPPTVAIVGRPNVGKSTLFNRLTGKRSALVSDLPGLTRDRREGKALVGGNPILLVDTAGLEEAAQDSIPARMRAQSEQAIASADLVLFVIDARSGITPADRAFAASARRVAEKVILVANKCEGKAGAGGFYEAYELGLGEPVAISAEHGEGLSDLETEILEGLGLEAKLISRRRRRRGAIDDDAASDQATDVSEDADDEASASEDPTRPIKIAVVGRPNAGKSTLVNTILGEERMITGPEPGLTRDSISTDLVWKDRRIKLFDTAGLRRKARISEHAEKLAASDSLRAIRFAEVVVLLIDAGHPFEQQDLVIGNRIVEEGRALVIAVNKWDAVEDKQKALKDIRETADEKFADASGVAVVPVSALSGRGVDKVMEAVLSAYDVWNKRVSTAALNRWLQEALDRHTPPASSGRRIRIRYVTQPSSRPPTFVAFCSKPGDLPASYIRYLVNSLREAFDLPGTPIRFGLRKGANPFAKD